MRQGSYSGFVSFDTTWTQWARTTLGLRAEQFDFDVESNLPASSGSTSDSIVSPKLALVLGPWSGTEFFFDIGRGFHGNDARGTTIRVDPTDGVTPVERVDAKARTTRNGFCPPDSYTWAAPGAREQGTDRATTAPGELDGPTGKKTNDRPQRGIVMFSTECLKGLLLGVSATALLAPALAVAQDRDTKEIQSYVLTEAGLARYTQATKKLAAMKRAMPANCDDDSHSESDSKSLDDMAAKLDAVPDVKAAIQSAGMTTREYAVFSMSLLSTGLAAWAVSQPGGKLPAGTSKTNVDFYKKHEADFRKLQAFGGDGDCEDDDAEEKDQE